MDLLTLQVLAAHEPLRRLTYVTPISKAAKTMHAGCAVRYVLDVGGRDIAYMLGLFTDMPRQGPCSWCGCDDIPGMPRWMDT